MSPNVDVCYCECIRGMGMYHRYLKSFVNILFFVSMYGHASDALSSTCPSNHLSIHT